jgi:hypothetical protein
LKDVQSAENIRRNLKITGFLYCRESKISVSCFETGEWMIAAVNTEKGWKKAIGGR